MTKNNTKSQLVRVTISEQVGDLLDQIAATGLMGQNPAEVAHRFIDEAVMKALANPLLKLKPKTKRREGQS
ncbi:MAG: hypothetical protein ABI596_03020 [Pyrinomonadaceae bacterium]